MLVKTVLPTQYNSGKPVDKALLDRIIACIVGISGGATVKEARGLWIKPETGKLFDEPVLQVDTTVPDNDDDLLVRLGHVFYCARRALAQEALYTEYDGSPDIITDNDEKGLGGEYLRKIAIDTRLLVNGRVGS